jgi:hypothetical protein
MVGHEAETGRSECYYSLPALDALQLSHLLARSHDCDPAALLDRLSELAGLPIATILKWFRLGLSTATDGSEQVQGVALFFRASAIPGGPMRIRDALLQQPRACESGNSAYRNLFGATEACALPDHGVVTLEASRNGTVQLRAGISGSAILSRWNPRNEPVQAA